QSTDYKWNDLEKDNSAWRVTLVDALGHEVTPEYVRVEKLPDVYEREFFPAKGPFTKSYSVRFAAGTDHGDFVGLASGSITLRFASPAGRIEVRWHSN
ncbi:MAG: putative lipoprotein, partial [Myxococcales bacterium]|nr:putative lipoprotein [Myxococcales bacterium]